MESQVSTTPLPMKLDGPRHLWWGSAAARAPMPQPSSTAPSGAGGVVWYRDGDFAVAFDHCTGRVEQVRIPSETDLSPAQAAALGMISSTRWEEFADGSGSDAPRTIEIRELDEYRDLFRLARLLDEIESDNPLLDPVVDDPRVTAFVLMEVAATSVALRMRGWLDDQIVEERLRNAQWALGEIDGKISAIELGVENWAAESRLGDFVHRWSTQLWDYFFTEPPEPVASLVDVLARDLDRAWPDVLERTHAAQSDDLLAYRGLVATATDPDPVDQPVPSARSALALVGDRDDLQPGVERPEPVNGGVLDPSEHTCRRLGFTGPGTIGDADRAGWHEVEIPARIPRDEIVASRWILCYGQDGENGAESIVGGGPLRWESNADSTLNDEFVAGRITGLIPSSAAITGYRFREHPAIPTDPRTGREIEPDLDVAIFDARLALRLDAVGRGDEAVRHWTTSALTWMRLGVVRRAADAWTRGDPDELRAAFVGDDDARVVAEALVQAALRADPYIGSGGWSETDDLDHAWWYVASEIERDTRR
jgi:hypothetical protein